MVAWRIDFENRKVIVGVGPNQLSRPLAVVGKGDDELARVFHHMVIGENRAGIIDQKACARTGLARNRTVEKIIVDPDVTDVHHGRTFLLINADVFLFFLRKP